MVSRRTSVDSALFQRARLTLRIDRHNPITTSGPIRIDLKDFLEIFLGSQSAGVWAVTGQAYIENSVPGFHEPEPNNLVHCFVGL